MNHLLFAASVGHRMTLGASLGEALFAAAINHERECEDAARASYAKYGSNGEITEEGKTLAEFFATLKVEQTEWLNQLAAAASVDASEYLSEDATKFDIEHLRDKIKIRVESSGKVAALKLLQEYLDDTTYEEACFTVKCTEIAMPRDDIGTATFTNPRGAVITVPYEPMFKIGKDYLLSLTTQENQQ